MRYTPSPSPAERRQLAMESVPSKLHGNDITGGAASFKPSVLLETPRWRQVKYILSGAPQRGFSMDAQRAVTQNLENHLIEAIKTVLQSTPSPAGPDLYINARFQVPVSVAQSLARGELGGDTADIFSTLADIITYVPVAEGPSATSEGQRLHNNDKNYVPKMDVEVRRTSRDEGHSRRGRGGIAMSPDATEREEARAWEQERRPVRTRSY